MSINIIVACDKHGGIGAGNTLPWELKGDMKWFKFITSLGNNCVIMGRTTWESIPERYRPLTDRQNIVLSRDSDYNANGAIVCNSLDTAIDLYKSVYDNVFIIGGASIYKQATLRNDIDKMYITDIDHVYDNCDVVFDMPNGWTYDTISTVKEGDIEYSINLYTN